MKKTSRKSARSARISKSRLATAVAVALCTISAPAIGTYWPAQGGHYAGIGKGQNGAPDHLLIVHVPGKKANWGEAVKIAKGITEGKHKDWDAPTRADGALAWANVPDLFEKTWYWTGTQYASASGWAWFQSFTNGYQLNDHKSYEDSVFAVRRVPIQ